jgi:hypothetical protein
VHLRSLDLGEEGCEARVARIACGGGNLPSRRPRTTEEKQDGNTDKNSSHDLTSPHKARPPLECIHPYEAIGPVDDVESIQPRLRVAPTRFAKAIRKRLFRRFPQPSHYATSAA